MPQNIEKIPSSDEVVLHSIYNAPIPIQLPAGQPNEALASGGDGRGRWKDKRPNLQGAKS